MKNNLLIGAHFSIANGVENAIKKAIKLNCNVVQIFTKSSRRWESPTLKEKNINDFISFKEKFSILTASHASYLINLCNSNSEHRLKSKNALIDELKRADILKIPYLIIHPGSNKELTKIKAIKLASKMIDEAYNKSKIKNVKILLETTAGHRNSIGNKFEYLKEIMNYSNYNELLGICIDTCHIFSSGYKFSTKEEYTKTMNNIIKIIGLNKILLFHFNDSKTDFNSKIDRHENIGKGYIGIEPFRFILNDKRFKNIGKCLETPKGDNDEFDIINLKLLRSLIKT